MSLYLYKHYTDNKYFCFTESEAYDLINFVGFKEEEFKRVTSKEEYRLCLSSKSNKHPMATVSYDPLYKHPTDKESYLHVQRRLKKLIDQNNDNMDEDLNDKIFISDEKDDIIFSKYLNIRSTVIRRRLTGLMLLREQIKSSGYTEFTVILKTAIQYEEKDYGHVFITLVEVEESEISTIKIIDTGHMTRYNLRDYAEAISMSLKIKLSEKYTIENSYKKVYDNFILNEELPPDHFLKLPDNSLQQAEHILEIRGYCAAWILYFISKIFIENNNIEDVYDSLFRLSPVDISATIIHWWNNEIVKK